MARPDRQRFNAGVALVLIGLGFFLVQRFEAVGSEIVMLLVGTAFLVAYFYQKAYGLLIPAGILLGLGSGTLLHDRFWWAADGTVLGLGAGFLAIYLIARIHQGETNWWPLVPGTILIIIGVPRSARIFRFLWDNWPLILAAIGLLVLIGAFRRGSGDAPPGGDAEPTPPVAPTGPEEPVEPRVE